MLVFCVTHEKPMLPQRFFTHEIALGSYRRDHFLHVSKISSFWEEQRPRAYGSAGGMILPEIQHMHQIMPEQFTATGSLALMQSRKDSVIGIASYRKVMLRSRFGARNFVVSVDESTLVKVPLDQAIPAPDSDFLVSVPLWLSSGISTQYRQCHLLIDLLDYTSLAIEMNILSSEGADMFLHTPIFFPGGVELGYYPSEWLKTTLMSLEKLNRCFIEKFHQRIDSYDSYQVRAIGFLSERLGSFLLMLELERRFGRIQIEHLKKFYPLGTGQLFLMEPEHLAPIPPEIFGYMHVVVESGGSYTRGTAS